MTTINRRDFLRLVGISGAAAGLSLLPGLSLPRRAAAQSAPAARIVLLPAGPVTIHTFQAPEISALVTSHVIETENSLYLVDTQFVRSYAQALQSYVDGLGKPLERVYLSHEHPDHWSGAEYFDAPFVSTATIAANVQASIDGGSVERLAGMIGADQVPTAPRVPEAAVEAGTETLDGVTVEIDVIADAEAPEQIVMKLPEAGVAILQDLLYNNAHFFALGNVPNWISVLEEMRGLAAEGYDVLLPGHGLPASVGEIDPAIEYLTFLEETIAASETAEEAIAALQARYPSYGGNGLLPFIAGRFAS